jgi:predicted dehydrogenase
LAHAHLKSILVAGAGSIGRRHLANLKTLGISCVAACDPHTDRLEYVANNFGAECFAAFENALEKFKPDAVLVCTPPVHHVEHARRALQSGAHVFIEKPLSDRMEGVAELCREADQRHAVLQVGYNLRFHPPIQKLKQLVEEDAVGKILWAQVHCGSYLPDWRPWQDYSKSYTARRNLGGGIILDGSHEIDYLTWLFGAPQELVCMAGRVSALHVNVEDCATMLLHFPNGMNADVHVDFVQRFYSRSCTLAGTEGKLHWDFASNDIQVFRAGKEAGKEKDIETLKFDCDVNTMYLAELSHFLECAQSGSRPRFGVDDAVLTLRLALAARRSAEERAWITLG